MERERNGVRCKYIHNILNNILLSFRVVPGSLLHPAGRLVSSHCLRPDQTWRSPQGRDHNHILHFYSSIKR